MRERVSAAHSTLRHEGTRGGIAISFLVISVSFEKKARALPSLERRSDWDGDLTWTRITFR